MRHLTLLCLAGGLAAGAVQAGEIIISDHRSGRSHTIVEPHLRPGEMMTIRDPDTGRTIGILEKPLRRGEALILRDLDTGLPIGTAESARRDAGREAARAAAEARRQRVTKD